MPPSPCSSPRGCKRGADAQSAGPTIKKTRLGEEPPAPELPVEREAPAAPPVAPAPPAPLAPPAGAAPAPHPAEGAEHAGGEGPHERAEDARAEDAAAAAGVADGAASAPEASEKPADPPASDGAKAPTPTEMQAALAARRAAWAKSPGALNKAWTCPNCTLNNSAGAERCDACGAARLGVRRAPVLPPVFECEAWTCSQCTLRNPAGAEHCGACGTAYELAAAKPAAEALDLTEADAGSAGPDGAEEVVDEPSAAAHEAIDEVGTCAVCYSIGDSLFQCPNGHIVCGECHADVSQRNDQCPTCKVPLGKIRALALEQLVRSRKRPCKYDCSTRKMAYDERVKHEKACLKNPSRFRCPHRGCQATVCPDSAAEHLRSAHGCIEKLAAGAPHMRPRMGGGIFGGFHGGVPHMPAGGGNQVERELSDRFANMDPSGNACWDGLVGFDGRTCYWEARVADGACGVFLFDLQEQLRGKYTVKLAGATGERDVSWTGPLRHARDRATAGQDGLRIHEDTFQCLGRNPGEFLVNLTLTLTDV